MKLQIKENGNCKFVKVKEERLDLFSSPKLIAEINCLMQKQGNKKIVLNISSCSYCDASGLSAIQTLHQICEKAMGTLLISGIQQNVDKLIKICRLDLVWFIVKDIHEVDNFQG